LAISGRPPLVFDKWLLCALRAASTHAQMITPVTLSAATAALSREIRFLNVCNTAVAVVGFLLRGY
jgi:uncharacterized protein (DUF2237 family)